MKDHPIHLCDAEVRALLAGAKTQARIALDPQPYPLEGHPGFWNASGVIGGRICISDRDLLDLHRIPNPGDRLWVREAWRAPFNFDRVTQRDIPSTTVVSYEEGGDRITLSGKLSLSRLMPRWASRLTLTVTDVRVQRLQDISEEDARAEGIRIYEDAPESGDAECLLGWDEKDIYRQLWDHINGPGSWASNPWVAAISFTVHRCNIDEMAATNREHAQ